ncbi:hypothetical protein ACLOJK_017098 [Asimina triloba]
MADLLQNPSKSRFQTAIWAFKLGFLAIGVISTFLLLKLAIPYSLNLFISAIPRIWLCFRSWLSPPYLYIIVNFIIISIVASSTFQPEHSDQIKDGENGEAENPQPQKKLQQQKKQTHSEASSDRMSATETDIWSDISSLPVSGENPTEAEEKPSSVAFESAQEVWSDFTCLPDSGTDSEASDARPSAESKGKSAGPSASVPAPSDRDHTLDATWKAITEGHAEAPKRQLKKSDTWDGPPHVRGEPDAEPAVAARRELRKSETFKDGASSPEVVREMSLSQDDLNRRVEAFIQNFRLQRQASYRQLQHMQKVNQVIY